MSLREKALRAYQLEQGRNEQEKAVLHATQTERTAKAFREMFGVEPDGVTIDDVVIEDLRLRAQYDKGEFRCFQLQGECPTCGKACYSQGVSSLLISAECWKISSQRALSAQGNLPRLLRKIIWWKPCVS